MGCIFIFLNCPNGLKVSMENSIDGEISVGKELSKVFIPLDNSSLIASTTLEGPLKKYKNFDETQVTEILRQQKNF